jgi:hypothetical protein
LSLPVLVSAHPGEHTESLELSKLPSIVLHLSRHRLLNQWYRRLIDCKDDNDKRCVCSVAMFPDYRDERVIDSSCGKNLINRWYVDDVTSLLQMQCISPWLGFVVTKQTWFVSLLRQQD